MGSSSCSVSREREVVALAWYDYCSFYLVPLWPSGLRKNGLSLSRVPSVPWKIYQRYRLLLRTSCRLFGAQLLTHHALSLLEKQVEHKNRIMVARFPLSHAERLTKKKNQR